MKTGSPEQTRKIAIVTCCIDDWGGSEELWARSLPFLQSAGYRIALYKAFINRQHPKLAQLAQSGVLLETLEKKILPGRPALNFFMAKFLQHIRRSTVERGRPLLKLEEEVFLKKLAAFSPQLVIIAQGINFDGLGYAFCCRLLHIPYVIICQKAVDFFWPEPAHREQMARSLQQAKQVFFVSEHNRRLTEEQFGLRLANAKRVFNPVKLLRKAVPYPATDGGFRLACVARLFLIDKGQDMLLRIMALEKWRNRPVTITLIGSGKDEKGLREMAALLQVTNVVFGGFQENMEALWSNYHAFVLPSRSEGLPLSMIEAMASGRVVIVSDAGGNAEMVEEGRTGFVGAANEAAFDEALERAWNRRHEWAQMGQQALQYIDQHVPVSPELDFANDIKHTDHE